MRAILRICSNRAEQSVLLREASCPLAVMLLQNAVSSAATTSNAVRTAACPSVRFCSRCKLHQRSAKQALRARHGSLRHATKALQIEVEEPATQKKRGRKKSTRTQLPSVRSKGDMQILTTAATNTLLVCSLPHSSKQSRGRSH